MESSGECSSARLVAVIADCLCRGPAGWHKRVLRRRGLFPTFFAEYLPAKLMGGKTGGYLCKGIEITYKMYFWYM